MNTKTDEELIRDIADAEDRAKNLRAELAERLTEGPTAVLSEAIRRENKRALNTPSMMERARRPELDGAT